MKLVIWAIAILIVFVIVIWILYKVFGSPECDVLANTTAVQLKLAIDEVASDNVPMYHMEGVPDNSLYYRTANIQLCQLGYETYNYFLVNFMGGFPQYQIYYGHFPEGNFKGGAHLWNEAYPWSGGAASSFVFWGAMRLVNVGGKALLWVVKQTHYAYRMWKLVRLLENVKGEFEDLRNAKFLTILSDPSSFEAVLTKRIGDFLKTRDVKIIGEILSEGDATNILNSLKKAGFLKQDAAGNLFLIGDKLVLNDQDIPVSVFKKVHDPATNTYSIVKKHVAIYDDSPGPFNPYLADFSKVEILDPTDPIPANHKKVMMNPAKEIPELIKDTENIDPLVANRLAYSYTTGVGVATDPLEAALKARFTKSIFTKVKERLSRFLDDIENKFYNRKFTVSTPLETAGEIDGLQRAVMDPAQGDLVWNNIFKKLEDVPTWEKIKDSLMVKFYFTSWDEVRRGRILDVTNELNKLAGVSALYEKSDLNVWRYAWYRIYATGASETTDAVREGLKTTVPKFNDYFASRYTNDVLNDIINNLKSVYLASPPTKFDFIANSNKEFLIYIAQKIETGTDIEKKAALEELGNIIAYFKQDTSTLPIPTRGYFVKYGVKELRKAVYITAPAFVTSSVWITKGIAAELMTESCTENSICVYTHGAQLENPFHLSPDAKKYTVKLWRPVEAWKQWLGWQAALQHIPPHPRFYVVSPCFARAKIWKTDKYGEDTIFVLPEKIDLNDTASNYCYADEDLINAYTTIWFAADFATALEIVLTFGTSTGKAAMKTVVGQVWQAVDPIDLIQVGVEASLSWPGWPYKTLGWKEMVAGAANESLERLSQP